MNHLYKIPGYELHEFIAESGMGSVSTYWDKKVGKIDRLVVGKSLKRDLSQNPTAIKYFDNEFYSLLKLEECANIPRVHELIINGENRHIIMEHVRGLTLAQITDYLYNTREFMNPDFAAYTIYQIALALKAAHKKHLIHRDLKPANVMIRRRSDPVAIKVLDFGLAIEREWTEKYTLQAEEGTPRYMSPEQFKSEDKIEIDEKLDIHQLGQIFYQLLTNIPPFDNEDVEHRILTFKKLKNAIKNKNWNYIISSIKKEPISIKDRILESIYIQPRIINSDIPRIYSNTIERCLETDPRDRYTEIEEITEILEERLDRTKIEKEFKPFLQTISTDFPPITYYQNQ